MSYPKDPKRSVGDVTTTTETIQYIDVDIQADDGLGVTEYAIRLNGRIIKRLTPYQAARYGITPR